MAYALSYKAIRGKTTLYANIMDKETSLFWDEVNDLWVADNTAICDLALTESGSEPGVYTGSATFTPANGGVYQISVFDSANADYSMDTIEVYPSKTKTVLQIINAIQLEMGLPQSAALTDNFAKIILANMNKVLMDLLPLNNVFDHLKVQGSFTINSARPFYRLSPINVDSIDHITFLRRPDLTYISKAPDDIYFRTKADSYNASLSYSAPEFYRICQRDNGFPILEFTPAPDVAYIVSYEVLKSPKEFTAVEDYVPFPRIVKAGAHMFTLQGRGRDASAEAGVFTSALEVGSMAGANSHMGDFEV